MAEKPDNLREEPTLSLVLFDAFLAALAIALAILAFIDMNSA